MFFRQGHRYIGGADAPFFVSNNMIRSEGLKNGFTDVQVFDRKAFPIFNLPQAPGVTATDWNTVAMGTRVAPDGELPLPSEVRWVVDLTPITAPAPGPTPIPPPIIEPPPPPIIAGPIPSWVPMPTPKPKVTPSGSINVPGNLGMPIAIGLGVVGGLTITWWGMQHMFTEGLTDKERKNILYYCGTVLAMWGASKLLDLNQYWWTNVEGIAQKTSELAP